MPCCVNYTGICAAYVSFFFENVSYCHILFAKEMLQLQSICEAIVTFVLDLR